MSVGNAVGLTALGKLEIPWPWPKLETPQAQLMLLGTGEAGHLTGIGGNNNDNYYTRENVVTSMGRAFAECVNTSLRFEVHAESMNINFKHVHDVVGQVKLPT